MAMALSLAEGSAGMGLCWLSPAEPHASRALKLCDHVSWCLFSTQTLTAFSHLVAPIDLLYSSLLYSFLLYSFLLYSFLEEYNKSVMAPINLPN